MQHSKNFILSQETKRALGYLYREVEELEKKIIDLEDQIYILEQKNGK